MPLGYVPMAFGWALPMPLGGWVLVPNWKEGKSNQFCTIGHQGLNCVLRKVGGHWVCAYVALALGGWVLVPNWKEGKNHQFWVHWSLEA